MRACAARGRRTVPSSEPAQHVINSGDESAQHNPRAGRSQSVDGGQEVQCWIGHEPEKLFQIIMKTVQRKNPFIQRSESRLPRFSGQRNEIHQVQYIDMIDTRCKDCWSCHRCSAVQPEGTAEH